MALFIGLMSGTSLDAIDVVLVDFIHDMPPQLIAAHTYPWPTALRQQLLQLSQHPLDKYTLYEIAQLETQTGQLFADAILALLEQQQIHHQDIVAIGSPGQTLLHVPDGNPPHTWQLGDPNVIAQLTSITTIADFRRSDMAVGGQGAPLAPGFHNAFLRSSEEQRVVVNIGGIANITVLYQQIDEPVIGFDTGPGNALLDAWSMQQRHIAMDENGKWASSGTVQADLLARLLTDSYFQKPFPKSTGRDYFNLTWLNNYLGDVTQISAENIQATLAQLTITTIAQAILPHQPKRVLICGGGVHNSVLMQGLARALPDSIIESTIQQGLHPDWIEAMCFAWLAKQRLEKKVGNLPSVTGARKAVILGGIYE